MLADAPLEELIIPPADPRNEEDFALVRCHSRLIEFQTQSYKQSLAFCQTQQQP